jgi:hypothetical protein
MKIAARKKGSCSDAEGLLLKVKVAIISYDLNRLLHTLKVTTQVILSPTTR